jgi:hypothetical protein
MKAIRNLGILLLAMATLLVGCSSRSAEVQLSGKKASVVEGLPVPQQAQLIAGKANNSGIYALPGGVSLSLLKHWYSDNLPTGQPWRDWTWCQPNREHGFLNIFGSGGGMIWNWQKDISYLTLNVFNDNGRGEIVESITPRLGGGCS